MVCRVETFVFSKMSPLTLSGKITYSPMGNFTLIIPAKNVFGDNIRPGSWGRQLDNRHHLTECYSEGCDNATLNIVTPNYFKFTDIHNDTISLTRADLYPITLTKPLTTNDTTPRDGLSRKIY